MQSLEVYDLETLRNLFTYTGYNTHTKQWHQFVISEWRNQTEELLKYLLDSDFIQVGFNNENFDYPIIHHLINHREDYKYLSGQDVAQKLYDKAQEIIENKFNTVSDKNKFIKQIDLFKIAHYDNNARRTSLKDLEVCLRMPNVQEMPIDHHAWCKEGDEDIVLSYNKNDVEATFLFLKTLLGKTDDPVYKGKDKIKLRLDLQKQFKIPCLNWPDVKIGEQLILKLYSNETKISPFTLKENGGTKRSVICLKDCIPHWANFETPIMQSVKDKFASTVITSIKNAFDYSINFHGVKVDYGTGGAHSANLPGIYESNDDYIILDQDIGSLYPSLAIQLGLYPEHLGKTFLKIYNEDIVSVRLAEKKKPKAQRNPVIMEGYKLAANGIYGKSGEETSVLYDPLYTMKTTIGGQMFISLWCEKLAKAIPDLTFIQWNTDGITYRLKRKDLSKAKEAAEEMSKLTGLYIEDTFYSKFIMRDVNNYLAVYEDGKSYKAKGCFEIDKEYHKDPSMRIVPIALKEYYLNNVPVEETIKNHKDIYDFCLRLKLNSLTDGYFKYIENKQIKIKKLQRTTRYYISDAIGSGDLIKDFGNNRISGVNIGFKAKIFNTFEEKEDYEINYSFYINKAYKIINSVTSAQLTLF